MIQPWMAKDLHDQRTTELERVASERRAAPEGIRPSLHGVVAVRVGSALVALGWRLGGSAALPATVRRRVA